MKTKLPNRPPFTTYYIRELIKAGNFQEAQNATDQCELYFAAKAEQARDLFRLAEKGKRGHQISNADFAEVGA